MPINIRYRSYRFLWDYATFLSRGAMPVHLDLEVTARCNLSCVMCPHGTEDKQFKIGDMDYAMAKSIIKSGSGKIKSVKFNWRGEPTLYRQLPGLISYAKDCGYIETMINTNLNCSKKILEDVILSGLDKMIISIDSFDPLIYAQIRKRGDLKLVLENLNFVKGLKLSRKNVLAIVVQARRQKLNAEEIFPSWVKERPAVKRTPEGGYLCGGQVSSGRRDCLMPLRRLLVSWDGFVYGCCADWFGLNSVGRIEDNKPKCLSGIWNGPKIDKLRRELRTKKAFEREPCKSCFSRESYLWKK